ncbi:hypothetical protein P153DRAFT_307651 [Dothidotthia symphoricarpi CBS 119687]|uniref:Uncharacterized protein n=1 Tax=Dothidotthia symphoricarpi CBS 119687 TaxID=1392245 RepID=A0A6A6AME4_9PLEO|nr:uncharacterized protein P153DRAFT_307651 [Dothidotthia symphoricarpi CBS 119687]KAF2133152.1 hypothetical protein P153DRAFT_307651 [Dothidotthia symphoricarpi CBS 119687]
MQTYLNKQLRRLSKQPEAHVEQKSPEPSKTQEPVLAGPSEPAQALPAPKATTPVEEPISEPMTNEEDEMFLERLTAIASEPEGTPPPLPTRPMEAVDNKGEKKLGRDAQEALMDGANKIPLPTSPSEANAENLDKGKGKKTVMSYFSMDRFKKTDKEKDTAPKAKKGAVTEKDKAQFADDLREAVEVSRAADLTETQRENKELTLVLDQLNLSAVNNRVFSFSKESEELLNKFVLVLKDIINGAPTAYNDLEKLFTDYDAQLKKMYGNLPPFLQNMVKSLPAKLTATLGPEILAAQAAKPGFDAKQQYAEGSKTKSKKSRIPGLPTIPSLKQLISAQGAVATALKSILNFLKLRFPTLAMGTNLIMSLAVFLLLFVFWYCHKRGREVRLEKERVSAEGADSAAGSSMASIDDDNDSIFGDKKPATRAVEQDAERPTSPLIINDGREEREKPATVNDLPSVSHLPDPNAEKVPVSK